MTSPRTPRALAHLERELALLEVAGLRRTRPPPHSGRRPSFCSNDYLGLARTRDGFDAEGGAAASRLVVGESNAHLALERALADWLGVEGVLLYSSGYAANVGALSALVRPGELVVSDALNHASIIDGCRLAKAAVEVVPHLDVEQVERVLRARASRPAWVVTESYFGMDADTPDLRRLRRVCDELEAGLIVDEAHALGVLGPEGRGLARASGAVPDVLVGTLGKAFGRQGAFVAGSQVLIDWLWNRSRSFVFSTGLSPALAASAHWAFDHARAHPELRATCLARAHALRTALGAAGTGPILPVVVGRPERAMELARLVTARGIHVQAIRPPTVPPGTARLRVTLSAAHTPEDVEFAADVLGGLLGRFT